MMQAPKKKKKPEKRETSTLSRMQKRHLLTPVYHQLMEYPTLSTEAETLSTVSQRAQGLLTIITNAVFNQERVMAWELAQRLATTLGLLTLLH